MTTDEAAKKWCPLMKNKDETNICISSNCMMWRWVYTGNYVQTERGYCGLAGELVVTGG